MLEIKQIRSKLFGPLDVSLNNGQCSAILGKSGCGKSIFLRAIADLDPNQGEVWLNGIKRSDIAAFEWRSKVMLVPAESGWWADVVGEHFADESHTLPLLAALDLPPEILKWQVSRLSTGERQRLAIVRSLALKPDALLLDEPTAALDPEANALVEKLLKQQLVRGVCMILVTHDAKQAERLADRTYQMVDGKLIETSRTRQETLP